MTITSKYEYRGVALEQCDKNMLIQCVHDLKREVDNLRQERDRLDLLSLTYNRN